MRLLLRLEERVLPLELARVARLELEQVVRNGTLGLERRTGITRSVFVPSSRLRLSR